MTTFPKARYRRASGDAASSKLVYKVLEHDGPLQLGDLNHTSRHRSTTPETASRARNETRLHPRYEASRFDETGIVVYDDEIATISKTAYTEELNVYVEVVPGMSSPGANTTSRGAVVWRTVTSSGSAWLSSRDVVRFRRRADARPLGSRLYARLRGRSHERRS